MLLIQDELPRRPRTPPTPRGGRPGARRQTARRLAASRAEPVPQRGSRPPPDPRLGHPVAWPAWRSARSSTASAATTPVGSDRPRWRSGRGSSLPTTSSRVARLQPPVAGDGRSARAPACRLLASTSSSSSSSVNVRTQGEPLACNRPGRRCRARRLVLTTRLQLVAPRALPPRWASCAAGASLPKLCVAHSDVLERRDVRSHGRRRRGPTADRGDPRRGMTHRGRGRTAPRVCEVPVSASAHPVCGLTRLEDVQVVERRAGVEDRGPDSLWAEHPRELDHPFVIPETERLRAAVSSSRNRGSSAGSSSSAAMCGMPGHARRCTRDSTARPVRVSSCRVARPSPVGRLRAPAGTQQRAV